MNTVYSTLKEFLDGMLGSDFAATSKYIAGGIAVAICIGLFLLIYRFFKYLIRV